MVNPLGVRRDLSIGETAEFNELCKFLREKIEEGYGRRAQRLRQRSAA